MQLDVTNAKATSCLPTCLPLYAMNNVNCTSTENCMLIPCLRFLWTTFPVLCNVTACQFQDDAAIAAKKKCSKFRPRQKTLEKQFAFRQRVAEAKPHFLDRLEMLCLFCSLDPLPGGRSTSLDLTPLRRRRGLSLLAPPIRRRRIARKKEGKQGGEQGRARRRARRATRRDEKACCSSNNTEVAVVVAVVVVVVLVIPVVRKGKAKGGRE